MGPIFMVKGPTNWWRVAALVTVPMFIYTTWKYAETAAALAHLREHFHLELHPGLHAPAKPVPDVPPKLQ